MPVFSNAFLKRHSNFVNLAPYHCFPEKAVESKNYDELVRIMKIIDRDHLRSELDPALVKKAQDLIDRMAKLAEAMKVRNMYLDL